MVKEQKEPDTQLNAVSEIFNMVIADIARAEPSVQVESLPEKPVQDDVSENKKVKRISKAER